MNRCQHLKVNGTQCGSPALRGKRFCYFHSHHQLKPAKESAFDFPILEDANAIQVALMQVIRAIADNKIESKRAGLLLYALQTASYNLKRTSLQPEAEEVVRDTSALAREVAPPPDPIDFLRAMRRDYWKMRDPKLINRDREIVARECAAEAAPTPHVWPGSSTRDRGSQTRATPPDIDLSQVPTPWPPLMPPGSSAQIRGVDSPPETRDSGLGTNDSTLPYDAHS